MTPVGAVAGCWVLCGCNSRLNLVRLFKTPPHPVRARAPPHAPLCAARLWMPRVHAAPGARLVCLPGACASLVCGAAVVCVPVRCSPVCAAPWLFGACGAALPLLLLPLLRPGVALPLSPRRCPGALCILVHPAQYLAAPWCALLPLLCRGPELPGTAPTLAAYGAGAPHAALLHASVTINLYA